MVVSTERDDLLNDALDRSMRRLLCRMVGPSPLHPKLDARRTDICPEPASAWTGGSATADVVVAASGRTPLVEGAGGGVPAGAGV
jgi:hypothetical protein